MGVKQRGVREDPSSWRSVEMGWVTAPWAERRTTRKGKVMGSVWGTLRFRSATAWRCIEAM